MGRNPVDAPSPNTLAQRKSRERRRRQQLGLAADDLSGIDADSHSSDLTSSDLVPAGLVDPPTGGAYADSLEAEQALWVRRRREITELELSKRRGDLISLTEAKAQRAAAGRRIRAALDRIPQFLPGHLPPEQRAACETAIKSAVSTALADL